MSYLIRILAIVGLLAAILLIVSTFEEKGSILVESSNSNGTLFLNGLFESGDSFCFKPENSTDYNVALVGNASRQNILVSKSNEINIGKSEGENLGLKVTKISQKTLENDPRCQ